MKLDQLFTIVLERYWYHRREVKCQNGVNSKGSPWTKGGKPICVPGICLAEGLTCSLATGQRFTKEGNPQGDRHE